ncbi:MAG TPA: AraC family transcriptional regulator [Mobilitalea sp.]|nr:AraC family transcriptional regulator [Mobilitalea sp.]
MNLSNSEKEIFHKLVGPMGDDTAAKIKHNIDCFLHPKVSLFIPSVGQCQYAVTPNHTHPAYSFIYYFQPVNEVILEEKLISYDLSGGRCLAAMSPNIPHQEVEQEYFQSYIAILIDKSLFEETVLQYIEKVPVFRGEIYIPHPELLGLLRCFMLEAREHKQSGKDLLDKLAPVVTHYIIQSVITQTRDLIPLYDRFEVDRAIAYMNTHYSDKITTEDLAERVNLSAGHFSKIFKTVTGASPIDFLNILRLQKACYLLIHSTKNITEIALECGFNTSSYFSTCFLEKYRTTPTAYRMNFHRQ